MNISVAEYSNSANGEVMKYVYDPARQLGVPVRVAISMVVRYAANLDERGTYVGCVRALRDAGCYKELDGKMRINYALVISAVVPVADHDLRYRLQDAADAQRRQYLAGLHALLAEGPSRNSFKQMVSIEVGEHRTQKPEDDSVPGISQPVTGTGSEAPPSGQRGLCHRMLKAVGFDAKPSSSG